MTTTETEIRSFFGIPIENYPDRSTKWFFQASENVRGLIEILATELVGFIDFSRLTPLNRRFISDTLREQESDIVFRVPFQGESQTDDLIIYILIEHQSTVDDMMGFRVLFYMMQLWDEQRRDWESNNVPKSERRFHPILPIVFYTGERRWTTPLSLTALMEIPNVLSRFIPKFDTLFLSVKETDAAELTKTDHPLGWLLTVLQKEHADVETLSEALIATMARLNELDASQAAQKRRAIVYLLLLILHRRPAGEHEDLITLVNKHTHDMEVETMAQSMAEILIEQGIEQGMEQGIEQGMEQGRVEGRAEAKQAALLRLLTFRFDSIPASLVDEVHAIQSLSRLDSLFEKALGAETLDDFDVQNHNA